jgi:glycosyltransferase involved in cell wall biosynthesis
MAKVSIIVPIYNVEKYLEKCLNSLINQTLTDIEIILVNDGSTDNSGKIADSYAANDKRIKVIHQKNAGLSSARNAGLACASGTFVGFVDPDDWIDEKTYEKMYSIAMEENCDVVSCAMSNVYKHGIVPIPKSADVCINLNEIGLGDFGITYFDIFSSSACNKLYKRDIIEKHKLSFIDNKIIPSEDGIFNIMFLVHATKVRILPDRFYFYVKHYGSITTTKKKDSEFVIKMVSMVSFVKEYVKKNGKDIENWWPFLYFNYLMSGLGNIEKNGIRDIAKQLSIVYKEKLFIKCFKYLSKSKNFNKSKIQGIRRIFTILFSKLVLNKMFFLAALMLVLKQKRLDLKISQEILDR